MKPDWKDAPEWANWLAMDSTGDWFWYENQPKIQPYSWTNVEGRTEWAALPWKKTAEARPDE